MEFDFKKILSEKDDPDYIVSCLKLLTTIERSILLILHTNKVAMTTKEVQDEFLLNLVQYLKTVKLTKLIPYYNQSHLDKSKNLDFDFLADKSQKTMLKLKSDFQKNKIPYPSFEKICYDLTTLEKMGVILKRESQDKKSKGLWAINPIIDFYLKKANLKLFDNQKISPIGLTPKTINFDKIKVNLQPLDKLISDLQDIEHRMGSLRGESESDRLARYKKQQEELNKRLIHELKNIQDSTSTTSPDIYKIKESKKKK